MIVNSPIVASLKLHAGIQRVFLSSLVFGCLLVGVQPSVAQQRVWTDASGTYKVEAVLDRTMEVDGKIQAVLIDGEGQEIPVPLSRLSEESQKLVIAFMRDNPPKKKSDAVTDAPNDAPRIEAAESKIMTRPLELPITGRTNTNGQLFNPENAIRIDREVKRDQNGQPLENPVYQVEVDAEGIRLLPTRQQQLAMVLMDGTAPIGSRRRAVEALADSWPTQRSQELINIVINTASSDDKFLRMKAMDILAARDSDQSLGYLLARIDDRSFEIRSRAYELLEKLGDPRIIPELAERLDGADRRKVGRVLKSFGSASTPWVIPWLETENQKTLLDVCQLLGQLGGDGVIEALQKKIDSTESLLVKAQSENSIKKIRERAAMAAKEKAASPN